MSYRQPKDTYLYVAGIFGLGLLLVFLGLALPACKHPIPAMDVSFWAGDSAKDGISRSQENKTLKCTDPEFDNYTCLTYADIQRIMDVMLMCQQWPASHMLIHREMKRFMKHNPEVIQHVVNTDQERLEPVQP